MSIILIPATKSLTVTNKFLNGNINEETLIVGNNDHEIYISYLFFDISTLPINVSVVDAELVLFKQNNFFNDFKSEFFIYPLSDYFSSYTTYSNKPSINAIVKSVFYPLTSKIAVTANLTYIVSLWYKNELSNTGIALMSRKKDVLMKFGSSINCDSYLTPFLKVAVIPIVSTSCFKKDIDVKNTGTTKQIRVIGTVAPASVYESIVNVEVTRNITGSTDNYYVADEYNNSISTSPLSIDKTYNIAIIPSIKPGDVETIHLYGSYKE